MSAIGGGTGELRIVCSEPLVRDGLESVLVPWTLGTEAAEVSAFDIGVMPLRTMLHRVAAAA